MTYRKAYYDLHKNDKGGFEAKFKHNPIAKTVKLADLRHNSDLSRLEEVSAYDLERAEKYKKQSLCWKKYECSDFRSWFTAEY